MRERLRRAIASRSRRRWLPVVLLGLVALLPIMTSDSFVQDLAILTLLYTAMAASWMLIGGYGGALSWGHAVFFAEGAYMTALFQVKWSLSPYLAFIPAIGLAVVTALLAYPVLKLKSHYFVIATLGLAEVARTLVSGTPQLGGATGLEIPLSHAGWPALQFSDSKLPYYAIALVLAGGALLLSRYLRTARLGLMLRALRDDELAAISFGIYGGRIRTISFCASGGLTAVCGVIYAQYLLYIDSSTLLSVWFSTTIVLCAVVGGIDETWGPLLGAGIFVVLQQVVHDYIAPVFSSAAALNSVLFGLMVVVIAIAAPDGLVPRVRELASRLTNDRRFSFNDDS